jgi:DNA-binding transcriptional regulator PaaX
MNNRVETAAVIDGLLRFVVGGGTIASILVAPGMAEVLDKPTRAYFNRLNKRSQQRELKRLLYYMKQRGLIKPTSDDYAHGLVMTKRGKQRIKRRDFENITITTPAKWDQKWRIVFFDIPEAQREGRRQLIHKLKTIGFQQLQQSVWVHPFQSRPEVEQIASEYEVQRYISYVEATGIDSENLLKKRFKDIILDK